MTTDLMSALATGQSVNLTDLIGARKCAARLEREQRNREAKARREAEQKRHEKEQESLRLAAYFESVLA